MAKIIFRYKGKKVEVKRCSWLGRLAQDLLGDKTKNEISLSAFETALAKKLKEKR